MRTLWFVLLTAVVPVVGPGQMGSPGGGETQAVALHPRDTQIIYAGAARGLCKTTRGGADGWPSTGLEALSPRVIALDPQNPDVLYVGTYQSGVYKTTDAAASWHAASTGLTNLKVRGIVVDSDSSERIYAATDGGGVFKSVDGGATWNQANRGLVDKTLRCLVQDPDDSDTLYACTWHGVYKTTDGAASWSANRSGLFDIDVAAIAVDPTDHNVIYAGTNPGGVHRSGRRRTQLVCRPRAVGHSTSWRSRSIRPIRDTSTRAQPKVFSAAWTEARVSGRLASSGRIEPGPWYSTPRPLRQPCTTVVKAEC